MTTTDGADRRPQWIWRGGEEAGPNEWLRFRSVPELEDVDHARLQVTADSRYILYVNGRRIGEGPPKGFLWRMPVDTYDVTAWLQNGVNAIGVVVVRHGVPSGRSDGGAGGLWLSLEVNGRTASVSDSSWSVATVLSRSRAVPRMAYGMEFIDVWDARCEDNWHDAGYREDPATWGPAVVHPPAQRVTHYPSTLPHLTRNPHYPVSLLRARTVRPPVCAIAFDLLAHTRAAGIPDIETGPVRGYLVTELHADCEAAVQMERMHPSYELDTFGAMTVNGEEIAFDGYGRASFRVRSGANLLIVRLSRRGQSFPSWAFTSNTRLNLRAPAPFSASPLAAALYPSDSPATVPSISSASDVAENAGLFAPVSDDDLRSDPFADTWGATAAGATLELLSRSSLLCDSPDFTVLKVSDGADAELILDFGEQTVGYVGVDIKGEAGVVVDMVGFEAMTDGEPLRTDNLNNSVRVVLDDGWTSYLSATRLGLRYLIVTVRGASKPVSIRRVYLLRAVYPVNRSGSFTCSDSALTTLWELGRRTVELCMDDTYVDCPTYEASFWTGDMRNEALCAQVAFGEAQLTRRCFQLAADSLARSPMIENVVPSGYHRIIPNWSFLWVVAVWEWYRFTGDPDGVGLVWSALLQQADTVCAHVEGNNLFRFADWNMMDWAALDTPEGCYPATESAWAAYSLELTAAMTELPFVNGSVAGSGRRTARAQIDHWRATAARIREGLNDLLWSEEARAYRDSLYSDGTPSAGFSQQTQIVLLVADCVPDDRKASVMEAVIAAPAGWVRVASPWMMWFRFEALARAGRHDLILETILERWGDMLRQGATTCWETFAGFFQGRWSPTRSWCHGWSAAPTYFLSRYQLGVSEDVPGGAVVTVAPVPAGLTWASGAVPVGKGPVAVDWSIEKGRFDLRVRVPEGVQVRTVVPQGLQPGEITVETVDAGGVYDYDSEF